MISQPTRRMLLRSAAGAGAVVAASTTATGSASAATTTSSSVAWLNVTDYIALYPSAPDDTTAIQAAFADVPAKGSVVYFPAGTYTISSPITVSSNTTVMGDGMNATVIKQTSTAAEAHGFMGTAVSDVVFSGLLVYGPSSGTGIGIYLNDNNGSGISTNCRFVNVQVSHFGSHGIEVDTPVVCSFSGCETLLNGGHGFFVNSNGTGGTSTSFSHCYANTNTQAGYYLSLLHYSAMTACAGDANGVGYYLSGCRAMSLNGCGSENDTKTGSTYDGTAYVISDSNTIGLYHCYNYRNSGVAVAVRSSTQTTITGFSELDPGSTATASITTDSASSGLDLAGCSLTKTTSLAAGSAAPLPSNTPNPADQNLLAWSYDPAQATGDEAPVSGAVQLLRVQLPYPATISTIYAHVGTAGSGLTSGKNMAGLYSASGSLLASTSDQSSAWTSTGVKPMALNYTAAAGTYYIALLATGTTPPSFARSTGLAGASGLINIGLPSQNARFATVPSTSTGLLPSSFTTSLNLAPVAYWAAIG